MLKYRLSNPRLLLPLLHSVIALALLLHLYLPHWREQRAIDVGVQQYIEREAREGRWPPAHSVGWEACYFGPPREIIALFPANVPALLIAGILVVPSNPRGRLLQPAPGRILPRTRILIFIALFSAVVASQWHLTARLLSLSRISVVRRRIVYVVPLACIPLALVLTDDWSVLLRLASLLFWLFMPIGTLLLYWRKREITTEPPRQGV